MPLQKITKYQERLIMAAGGGPGSHLFSKRRKSGERETRLVKKPELGKNIVGENRYEGPEARKIFSNFAEQGGKMAITMKQQPVQ